MSLKDQIRENYKVYRSNKPLYLEQVFTLMKKIISNKMINDSFCGKTKTCIRLYAIDLDEIDNPHKYILGRDGQQKIGNKIIKWVQKEGFECSMNSDMSVLTIYLS